MQRRVLQEGLKSEYEHTENTVIRAWIKRLMSMTMLPAFAVAYAWEWLQHPPCAGDSLTDAKLRALAAYFGRTWITSEFQATLRIHYDHLGSRTTIHAEGFHSSLNSRFGLPHPSLRSFLNWLQHLQCDVQMPTYSAAGWTTTEIAPTVLHRQRCQTVVCEAELRHSAGSDILVPVPAFSSLERVSCGHQKISGHCSHVVGLE